MGENINESKGSRIRCRTLGAGALGWPREMVWGGRGGGGSGWGHVYTRGGFMLMDGKTNTILYSKIK